MSKLLPELRRPALRRPGARRPVAFALVASLLLPGCGVADFVAVDKPPPKVSVKGYDIDLAFGEAPVEPTAPARTATVPPIFADAAPDAFPFDDYFDFDEPPPPRRNPSAPRPPEPCPEPGPNTVAEVPITADVKELVVAGEYLFKQSGTMEIVGLAKVPLPALTTRTIDKVAGDLEAFTFEVQLTTAARRQVQSYRVVPGDGIFLVGMTTTTRDSTWSFNPFLPVELLPLPVAENTPVTGVGFDPITRDSLVIRGTVTEKQRVSGCDELVDGWFVDANWAFQRGAASQVYELDYTVATQHGGFVIADHVVSTEVFDGLTTILDVTSSIGSIEPRTSAS